MNPVQSIDDSLLRETHKNFIAERSDIGSEVSNWKLLITENEIQAKVQHLADFINQKFADDKIVVTCILKGCSYFLVDLTRKLTIPHSIYFIEASSYHDKQVQGERIELLSILVPSKFHGRKVILLDELYDNGFTLDAVKSKLIEEIKLNPDDVFTCTLFHKAKNSVSKYEQPNLIGFANLPDLWYVGYGLDDRQEKRNWVHLYAIPKIEGVVKNDDDIIFDSTPEGVDRYQQIRKTIVSMKN